MQHGSSCGRGTSKVQWRPPERSDRLCLGKGGGHKEDFLKQATAELGKSSLRKENGEMEFTGSSSGFKEQALSLLWHRFETSPGNFCMRQGQQNKNKLNKRGGTF